MSKHSTFPKKLHHLVPKGDISQPFEELQDGSYLLAGKNALIYLNEKEVLDSGLWYEVQFAKWNASDHRLNVVWSQPGREGISVVTSTDNVDRLMEAIVVRTERTILATRSFYTKSGTRVSATVRRRADSELFSVLIADGPLDVKEVERGEKIEFDIRKDLGMDVT